MRTKRRKLDKKTLIIMSAVLAVQVIACGALGASVHGRKAAAEQALAAKEDALQNVRIVSASLPALREEYSTTLARVRFLEGALPPSDYIPTLLGQIEQAARENGVEILEFRPKPAPPAAATTEEAGDAPKTMAFSLNVMGSYGETQRFLQSLTRFRKVLALQTIALKPTTGTDVGLSPKLTGTMEFIAYVLPDAPELDDLAAPQQDINSAPANATAQAQGTPQG
jgi:Tfp pilus assembly protein PilO